jgi:UDP-2,4-diacetamido-2,4,6-trideoxy-beta-L-altropyranose hydrolase
MRCLTLADALHAQGVQCHFLCRPHPGNLIDLIAARGHRVTELPALQGNVALPSGLAHAAWLATDQASDATDCLAALVDTPATDLLVVDHYALDSEWERRMRPTAGLLMVLDDLADRSHDCELLLDPGIERVVADYDNLLPDQARLLIGPKYALLRPEFAEHRAVSLARRQTPQLRQILVTLGGADLDNVTGRVLDSLNISQLPDDVEVIVVLGGSATWQDAVRARAATMRLPVQVLEGVENMAELMTSSDLAIGAAGGTAWERCCLGLPTIQMVLAENQRDIGRALAKNGAAALVESAEEAIALLDDLVTTRKLSNWLHETSASASAIISGNGASEVLAIVEVTNA